MISQLSSAEREQFKDLYHQYKHQLDIFNRQEVALVSLRSYIQETVARHNLRYTLKENTPFDMLVALKKRVAPTDCARKLELRNQYKKLQRSPKSQNIDTWLQQWEMTFTDCKDLGIPEVADNQLVFDFLEAILTVSPEFSNVWTVNLQTTATIGIGPAIPTLYKIVEVYRNYR